jgi:hypothetical protein
MRAHPRAKDRPPPPIAMDMGEHCRGRASPRQRLVIFAVENSIAALLFEVATLLFCRLDRASHCIEICVVWFWLGHVT